LATTVGNDGQSLLETDPVMAHSIICSSTGISQQFKKDMTRKLLSERLDDFGPVLERISRLTSA
ncbi:MAG: hypothetical protein DRR04_07760, partial [Gammaproteobacteria bacterium]